MIKLLIYNLQFHKNIILIKQLCGKIYKKCFGIFDKNINIFGIL